MSWTAHRYRIRLKHYEGRNRHHNIAKSLGGSNEQWNLILMKIERHDLLHKIFGLRDINQIITVLQRLQRMKERQRV